MLCKLLSVGVKTGAAATALGPHYQSNPLTASKRLHTRRDLLQCFSIVNNARTQLDRGPQSNLLHTNHANRDLAAAGSTSKQRG